MKNLKLYLILGTIFIIIAGTLSHFVYDWSGQNFVLGFFFPVNESTWEHMKLIFFPMLIYSLFVGIKYKENYPCLMPALLLGSLWGTFFIPVLFYTYTGILGNNYAPLDIAVFVVSVIIAFTIAYRNALSCQADSYRQYIYILTFIILLCFMRFTYSPPAIGIFSDLS